MTLLLQTGAVGAVFAAAALAARWFGRVPARRAIPAVVAVAATVAAAVELPAASSELLEERNVKAKLSTRAASLAGGAVLGVDLGFLSWARGRLRPGDRFNLMPRGKGSRAKVYQWTTYQLLPHLASDSVNEADLLLFYDVVPAENGYDPRVHGPLSLYDGRRNFGVARRRRR